MDKPTDKGEKENDSFQKLDLSALRDFNFASNWSESPAAPARREREPSSRGGPSRDRRPDRRPGGARPPRSAGGEVHEGGRPAPREDRGPSGRAERPTRRGRPEHREERQEVVLLRESPFDIQVFPDEPVLATLTKAMRHSIRTYELFEVARLILEKPERFHVSIRFRNDGEGERPLFQSVPDGLPFVTEEAAIDHVFRTHLEQFFAVEEVEAEAPKGSFPFIARCTLTGDFLGPPNYHRYQTILLQYYQDRFSEMPFERFRSHIETVKDEEAIQRWLESMTKQKRYKLAGAEGGDEKVFETPEEARAYLLQEKKDRVVRTVKAVRLAGKRMEEIIAPEIRPYVLAYAENQKRFPLDTANTMRGRLRRQHFFIYKKGARGISLVCAVKRRHREPGQVFSESIQAVIDFLEKHDQIVASHLPQEFLGIAPTPEGEEATPLDPEADAKLKRLNLDLRWLLSEGYVTEYSDGRLSVHSVAAPETFSTDRRRKPADRSEPEAEPKTNRKKTEAEVESKPVSQVETQVPEGATQPEAEAEVKPQEEAAAEPEKAAGSEATEPAEAPVAAGDSDSAKLESSGPDAEAPDANAEASLEPSEEEAQEKAR